MILLSWNLAGRGAELEHQINVIESRSSDLVALQEVTQRNLPKLRARLAAQGLQFQVDSFSAALSRKVLRGPRRYGQLIASRFPLRPLAHARFELPWPERLVGGLIECPHGSVEIWTTHVPPGSSNGWIKIETLAGLYAGFAVRSDRPRILCGDFNTPREELESGEVVTWGQRRTKRGEIVFRRLIRGRPGGSWDAVERQVLVSLAEYDLHDVFRHLYGCGTTAFSWFAVGSAVAADTMVAHEQGTEFRGL